MFYDEEFVKTASPKITEILIFYDFCDTLKMAYLIFMSSSFKW